MSRLLAAQRALTVPSWVKDELWRRARATPSLDLRFADSKSLVDATTGQNLVTFTRASEATFVNSQGQIQTAAINAPRFDHNPTTGESLGLLVEESRQNLLLNSGTLSTQNVTVTAVAHTLSFTGTGTITLSGTSTAGPLVGTGTGEANRVSLTFTPTAGTLTLTVSGTVTNAQLEIGAFRTSYIPTAGTAATRSADVCSISGSNFSSWYRQDEGSFFARGNSFGSAGVGRALAGNQTNYFIYRHAGGAGAVFDGTNLLLSSTFPAWPSPVSFSMSYSAASQAMSVNGSTTVTGASNGFTGSTQLVLGGPAAVASLLNGCISRLIYWPQRLGNEVLQRITQ